MYHWPCLPRSRRHSSKTRHDRRITLRYYNTTPQVPRSQYLVSTATEAAVPSLFFASPSLHMAFIKSAIGWSCPMNVSKYETLAASPPIDELQVSVIAIYFPRMRCLLATTVKVHVAERCTREANRLSTTLTEAASQNSDNPLI